MESCIYEVDSYEIDVSYRQVIGVTIASAITVSIIIAISLWIIPHGVKVTYE